MMCALGYIGLYVWYTVLRMYVYRRHKDTHRVDCFTWITIKVVGNKTCVKLQCRDAVPAARPCSIGLINTALPHSIMAEWPISAAGVVRFRNHARKRSASLPGTLWCQVRSHQGRSSIAGDVSVFSTVIGPVQATCSCSIIFS